MNFIQQTLLGHAIRRKQIERYEGGGGIVSVLQVWREGGVSKKSAYSNKGGRISKGLQDIHHFGITIPLVHAADRIS